jgi:Superinfection immunity protein
VHPILLDSATDSAAAGGAGVLLLLFLVAGAALYFLPTIIAVARKLRSIGPVVVINAFLGWTFIGWVCALAMSFGQTKNDPLASHTIQVFPAPPALPPTPQLSPDAASSEGTPPGSAPVTL